MKIIFFDVGNVIVKANHNITKKYLESLGVSKENSKNFFNNEDYYDFSRGKISGKEFYERLVSKHLKFDLSYEQIVSAHDMHLYDIDKDVMKIIKKIYSMKKYELGIITDTNIWQTRKEKELVDLSKYCKYIFRSHEMEMKKVDDGFFEKVLDELNVKGSEILFIDDLEVNLKKAKEVGIKTVLFKNGEKLGKELGELDLLG